MTTEKDFAKIWNDAKKSNEEIGNLLGGGKFSTAYNKKSRAPLNKLCTLKRTETVDPSLTGKPTKTEKKAKDNSKPKKEPKVTTKEVTGSEEPKVLIVTVHFRKPDGSNDQRILESDNKQEIWDAIQQISAKYGNTNSNLVDRSNRANIKDKDAIYDTLQVNLIRIPDGGRK